MIQDHIKRIVLASNSPRRLEIISRLGIPLKIMPQSVDEFSSLKTPSEIVKDIAIAKLAKLPRSNYSDICISADTIVWHDGQALGKPKDKIDAKVMLECLSGQVHEVYTGFAISYCGRMIVDYALSRVMFNKLTARDIDRYIKTLSPMDKAGGYGIQDGGLVASYCGDYDNIVGLPYDKVVEAINIILESEV